MTVMTDIFHWFMTISWLFVMPRRFPVPCFTWSMISCGHGFDCKSSKCCVCIHLGLNVQCRSQDWTWQPAGTAQIKKKRRNRLNRALGSPETKPGCQQELMRLSPLKMTKSCIVVSVTMQADVTQTRVIFTCETCPALYHSMQWNTGL